MLLNPFKKNVFFEKQVGATSNAKKTKRMKPACFDCIEKMQFPSVEKAKFSKFFKIQKRSRFVSELSETYIFNI